MLQIFLDTVLLIILGSLVIFAWIAWEEGRRDKTFRRIAEYIREVAGRCGQLADACSNTKTRSELENLSLDLTKKASEICPEIADDALLAGQRAPREQWHKIVSDFEAPLMIVAACTIILSVINYWLKLPPIDVTLAYFIPTAFIANRHGITSAVFALLVSIVLLAFVFYPPRYSIFVEDNRQLLELLLFCGICLVTVPIIAKRTTGASQSGN